MGFSFVLDKPKNLEHVISVLKSDAKKYKINYNGDEKQGSGSGYGFVGEYTVNSSSIEITVHKKPIVITKSKIIESTREYLLSIDKL